MTPQIKELTEALACKGISTRTTNIDEISQDTARLGRLWQKFYQNHAGNLAEGQDIYGVYHNYESDDEIGAFDVVASWEVSGEQAEGEQSDTDPKPYNGNLVEVTIPAGNYLLFSETGYMPNTVMNAWEKVSDYFNSSSCEHVRAFDVDFEQYIDGDLEYGQVDLYISVKQS